MGRRSLGVALGVAMAACGGPAPATDAGGGGDAGPPDAGAADAGGAAASLVGRVIRTDTSSVMFDPPPDGRGDLYVFLYDGNPAERPLPNRVGEVVLPDVDLSTPDRSVPYRIDGIPPRAEPYYVAAFLDDDENASPSDPRPTVTDTVAMDAGNPPAVVIDAAGERPYDVDLNLVLFFTPP